VIAVTALTRAYGLRPVLRGVDLTAQAGSLTAIFGPNGTGKSTLLRILATLIRPDAGQVSVAGYALPAQAEAARSAIGAVLHATLLYSELSADENLRFYARLYDLPTSMARIDELLERVGLTRRRRDPVRVYSRGMQQRLSLARALLHRPQVLLLDEPYTGLDPAGTRLLDEVLREEARAGAAVVLTSHDLAHGLALADQVVVLARGRVQLAGAAGDFTAETFAARYAEAVA
jgi:heme exporter protein A